MSPRHLENRPLFRLVRVACGAAALCAAEAALAGGADWNNFGGNAGRNGLTTVVGPTSAALLWENTDDFSIIAWHPVTLGRRVFAIRESGFPGPAANDALVAYDLDTGAELWREVVPYAGDPDEEWIAYVGGASDGKVYAARGGSGRTTPVYAYDAATGALLWDSDYETVAGPQDGFVFAPGGDLLLGDFDNITRIDAADGSTAWSVPRLCSVSGNCGVVANESAVYYDAPAAGGHVIVKLDLATGATLYSSPLMPGFTAQNAPFLSPDGQTVYFARSQNNPAVDFLYAFRDTGAELVERWSRPVRWTTSHEHGIGPDGSVYTFDPNDHFTRLDPNSGAVLSSGGPLSPLGSPNLSPRTAVDAIGTVYVSNGWASTPAGSGRIWAFTADLSQELFSLALDRQNSGGPSLGADGTLVVADRTGVYAYRAPPCLGDLDGDAVVTLADLSILLANFGTTSGAAPEDGDLDGDEDVDITDLSLMLSVFGEACG
jgi:outer membrane protein assembly factor BamB